MGVVDEHKSRVTADMTTDINGVRSGRACDARGCSDRRECNVGISGNSWQDRSVWHPVVTAQAQCHILHVNAYGKLKGLREVNRVTPATYNNWLSVICRDMRK